MEQAARARRAEGRRTILFVDEIHRFNQAQQDAFLPYVEEGTIVLIGATTENPSFEVNAPLLSRSRVYRLERLAEDDLVLLLRARPRRRDTRPGQRCRSSFRTSSAAGDRRARARATPGPR